MNKTSKAFSETQESVLSDEEFALSGSLRVTEHIGRELVQFNRTEPFLQEQSSTQDVPGPFCCAQDFRVDEYPCLVQLFSQSERENELSIESVQVCESFDGKRQLQQWRRGAGEFGAVTS